MPIKLIEKSRLRRIRALRSARAQRSTFEAKHVGSLIRTATQIRQEGISSALPANA